MFSRTNIRRVATIIALFCLVGTSVRGQEQAVDAHTKDELKIIMSHLIDTLYVSPKIGKELALQLRAKFESGAYNEISTPTKLAEALTRDLRESTKDPHLMVRYAPATSDSETILTPQEWEIRKASMFVRGPSGPQPGPPPAGSQGSRRGGPELDARTADQLQQSNYHFREAKYLSGNIGYLKLDGFAPGQAARETAAKTMALLSNSDGMIIDMRRCPGGSGEMVNFLASYFFDKEPRVLMNRYFRPTGETVQSKTIADIPGKRMLDIDLYLLVSANTASACESFAYTLQQYERAKVVGERTAGAGYNNVIIPIGKGYSFSVSVGSVVHPRSGKGWQIEGVQPDIVVKPDDALETAHTEALERLISRTTDQNRKKEMMSALQDVTRRADTANAVVSRPQNQAEKRLSLAEQEVRKLEREWLDAYEQHDTAAMDRILADDFKLTQSGGPSQTKADILNALKAPRDSSRPAPKFSTEEVESRVDGDTVILTGRFIQRMERDGQTRTMEARYIDTYSKRNGRWQVVASQLTPVTHKMSDAEIVKGIEAYLTQAVSDDAFSGAVLMAKDGRPIFEKAYGLANKSVNIPNNLDTKFNLGSINKSFTSVAIAQLAQQGRLSFNDPISKYLPDYPNKAVADKVTIHQLLTHTSGMGMYFNEEYRKRRASLRTLADLLPLFVNDPLDFQPGEKMQYSNSGYVVLGLIIERLSKQNYFDYVRQHIFEPAGMKNTDSYELEERVSNLAIGYTNMGMSGRPEPGPRKDSTPHLTGRGSSAGGGYSTLKDMLKFGEALIDHKLLDQKHTDIVLSNQMPPGQPPSGYGFFSVQVNGARAIGNNGGGPGTNSTFTVYPELGYIVVVLSNYDPPAASKVNSALREMLTAK